MEDIGPDDWDGMSSTLEADPPRKTGGRNLIVETESFALNPDLWYDVTAENMERLLAYLRAYACPRGNHWSDHVIADVIATLRGLLISVVNDPSRVEDSGWQLSVRTMLKRVMMSKIASEGKNAAFINAFSSAMDGGARPEWVTNALKQASREVKDKDKKGK